MVFSPDNFPAALVHLLPVVVGPGVGSALVLGVHADLGRVLAGKGLRVKTLLEGLGSELSLLSLLEPLQVKLLGKLPLLIVISVSLKLDDGLEEVLSLGLHLIRVHGLKLEGLDSDGKGNFLLLLKLLLGLGELLAGIIAGSTSNRLLLLIGISLLGLLGLKHLLPFSLSLLELLLLLLGLLSLPVGLLLLGLLLLLPLGGVELLLLLSPDLLPLGLLFLELGELILLGLPGLPPFCDVLLQGGIQLLLPLGIISSIRHVCCLRLCVDLPDLSLCGPEHLR